MKVGWRMISPIGRPGSACSAAVSGGMRSGISASSVSADSTLMARNDAPNASPGIMSFVQFARLGPRMPPTIPPASTSEIAFALNAWGAESAAAKR